MNKFCFIITCFTFSSFPFIIECETTKNCQKECLDMTPKEHNNGFEKLLSLALIIKSKVQMNDGSSLGFLIHSDFGWEKNLSNRDSKIFSMEQLMAGIIAIVANAKRNCVVNFDDASAWSCSTFTCLSSCEAVSAVLQNQASPKKTPFSTCLGNLEAACNMVNFLFLDCNYGHQIDREKMIAVAILKGQVFVNSPNRASIETRKDVLCSQYIWNSKLLNQSFDGFESYSPCLEHYHTRYAVGTHLADFESMEQFSSDEGSSVYVEFTEVILKSLLEMYTCLTDSCCSTEVSPGKSSCITTTGPFGELIDPNTEKQET